MEEELAEQLQELSESVPVPLELPDEETLVDIQEQILIHLPAELRRFLLRVSNIVYGSLEPVTACDVQSHTYLPDVASIAWSEGMPRELVPLCQDGDRYYSVEEDGTVVLWDRNTQELDDQTWESVWHWVENVWLNSGHVR